MLRSIHSSNHHTSNQIRYHRASCSVPMIDWSTLALHRQESRPFTTRWRLRELSWLNPWLKLWFIDTMKVWIGDSRLYPGMFLSQSSMWRLAHDDSSEYGFGSFRISDNVQRLEPKWQHNVVLSPWLEIRMWYNVMYLTPVHYSHPPRADAFSFCT